MSKPPLEEKWDSVPKKKARRARFGSDEKLAALVGCAIAGVLIYLAIR